MTTVVCMERLHMPCVKKCGDVTYYSGAGQALIILHCNYCNKGFGKIDLFLQHITDDHPQELTNDLNSSTNNQIVDSKSTDLYSQLYTEPEEAEMKIETELFEQVEIPNEFNEITEIEDFYDEEVLKDEEDNEPISQNYSTCSESEAEALPEISKKKRKLKRREEQVPLDVKRDVALEIIDEMQKYPCLWNTNHEHYNNNSVRADAHQAISDVVGTKHSLQTIDRLFVMRKIATLRYIFRACEEGKGAPAHDIYYERLSYLRGHSAIKQKNVGKRNENGAYICTVCSHKLRRNFRRHKQSYSFKCDNCQKKFYFTPSDGDTMNVKDDNNLQMIGDEQTTAKKEMNSKKSCSSKKSSFNSTADDIINAMDQDEVVNLETTVDTCVKVEKTTFKRYSKPLPKPNTDLKCNENGAYICSVCSHELRRNYRRHKRSYSYKCDNCQKKFYFKPLDEILNDRDNDDGSDVETTVNDEGTASKKDKHFNLENNEEMMLSIIDELQKHSNLWDCKHAHYTRNGQRSASFVAIRNAVCEKYPWVNIDKETIRRKVVQLRNYFYNAEKGRGNSLRPIYYERLSFLRGHSELLPRNNIKRNEDGTFTCPICAKQMNDSGNLVTHIRRHRKEYRYECEMCDRKFYTSSELRDHILLHTKEKPFICEGCGKAFRNHAALRVHKKRHIKQRDYKCLLCPKAFYRSSALRVHINSHNNVRPAVCKICQKGFYSRKTLQNHEKLHAEVKAYKCRICLKEFAQASGLNSHMKSH